MYDAFISHKSERKPWVEILAKNLQRAGREVFLDDSVISGGQEIARKLDEALHDSRNGILIATPEVASSGWVRLEYERMIALNANNAAFKIIPIRIGKEIADMPFLSNFKSVDFPGPNTYRESFGKLLAALRNEPPEPVAAYAGDLEIPEASSWTSLIQMDCRAAGKDMETEIFEKLQTRRAVLLCAQADQVSAREKDRLFQRALKDFGNDRVLRCTLPMGSEVDLPGFFRALARSCKLDDRIADAPGLAAGLRERAEASQQPLLLVIAGFEHGCSEGRRQLAVQLRSLWEDLSRLHFLVLGGEGLGKMYFSTNSGLSPLNIADLMEWPDLQAGDVQSLYRTMKPGGDLPADTATQTLALAGGHLRLIEYALAFLKSRNEFDPAACRDVVSRNPYLTQVFFALQSVENFADRLREIVGQNEIAPSRARVAGAYIGNAFVRRLYWQNLLKWQPGGKALAWRCELLREAGRQFLEIES